MCPCDGTAIATRTHMEGECAMFRKERDVYEEDMNEIDECDMKKFGALDR